MDCDRLKWIGIGWRQEGSWIYLRRRERREKKTKQLSFIQFNVFIACWHEICFVAERHTMFHNSSTYVGLTSEAEMYRLQEYTTHSGSWGEKSDMDWDVVVGGVRLGGGERKRGRVCGPTSHTQQICFVSAENVIRLVWSAGNYRHCALFETGINWAGGSWNWTVGGWKDAKCSVRYKNWLWGWSRETNSGSVASMFWS